jgi:hypothetical protein
VNQKINRPVARGGAIAKKQSQPHALFYFFKKRKGEAAHHQLRQAKI